MLFTPFCKDIDRSMIPSGEHPDFVWEAKVFRNLFAVFGTLLLGTGAASASAGDSVKPPLQQRLEAAQNTIGKLMDAADEQSSMANSYRLAADTNKSSGANKPPADKKQQATGKGFWNDWHNGWKNWGNNWHNGWNNWGNGWNNY